MKIALPLAGALVLLAGSPALAHKQHGGADYVQDDANPYWLDYRTDISEAKRELASDLRHADSESDRDRAWTEYRREIADARSDFRKEMIERGYRVGNITVGDPE